VSSDTYGTRKPTERPVPIVVISDDGVDAMSQQDEHGDDGAATAAMSLETARGGGSLVLNLCATWPPHATFEALGWDVRAVSDWEDLVAFARTFVLKNYGDET